MSYLRFGAMIATSTVAMFVLMYLNTYAVEHVTWSETRVYMAILMGACMAVIMLGYMFAMYPSTTISIVILVVSAIVFAGALWLVRSQATISQTSYMRAMIPHHSIAIMTSERAQITDSSVRHLADEIIEAQEREISEMDYLVAHLEGDGAAEAPNFPEAEPAEVVSVEEALNRAMIASVDPEPVSRAEADEVLTDAPGCAFAQTSYGDPILVARAPDADEAAEGVTKLNGALVRLQSETANGQETLLDDPTMVADGIRMAVTRLADDEPTTENGMRKWRADLVFELDRGLTVGYRGFYRCDL